jgi:hypothetical protein
MAQTYTQFKAMVSNVINRGTSLDSTIPYAVQHAVEFIEQNNNLKYMERFVTFQLDPALAEPRALSFPGSGFCKSIIFVRIVEEDDSTDETNFHFLTQIDPQDSKYFDGGRPDHYWLDGESYLWFDREPDEEYDGEMLFNKYSDIASLGASDNHWLITRANGLLLCETMIHMAPWMRNREILQFYKELRGEQLKTLLQADEEARQDNRSEAMKYGQTW